MIVNNISHIDPVQRSGHWRAKIRLGFGINKTTPRAAIMASPLRRAGLICVITLAIRATNQSFYFIARIPVT